jgi:hypothetical protein
MPFVQVASLEAGLTRDLPVEVANKEPRLIGDDDMLRKPRFDRCQLEIHPVPACAGSLQPEHQVIAFLAEREIPF